MTSYFVLDANFVYRSLFPETPQDPFSQLLLDEKREKRIPCAPTLLAYELSSILAKLVYWGELSEQAAQESLAIGLDLGIELVVPTEEHAHKAFLWTRQLNRVAAYDSFYLALAESLGCDLWTADKKLVNAVGQPWVRLVQ